MPQAAGESEMPLAARSQGHEAKKRAGLAGLKTAAALGGARAAGLVGAGAGPGLGPAIGMIPFWPGPGYGNPHEALRGA